MVTFEQGALDSLHAAHRSMMSAICEYEAYRGYMKAAEDADFSPTLAADRIRGVNEMAKTARTATRRAIIELRDFLNTGFEDEAAKPVIRRGVLAYLVNENPQSARACFHFAKGYCRATVPELTQEQVTNELERLVEAGVVHKDEEGLYEV